MLDNNEISVNNASNLLCYTYFPSISFVIGSIGIGLYNNYKFGLFLYLICSNTLQQNFQEIWLQNYHQI